MNQEEFNQWLEALDSQEIIDWLLPEIQNAELEEEIYLNNLRI